MKLKGNYFLTLKENVKDEESISANLLVRSGMIKKVGSGIYAFLPLGYRVLKKIENIIREEMDNISSNELVMPSILPEEYYEKSGRLEAFGDDMFRLHDRAGRGYVLGPTHEELFVEVAKDVIQSYKDMPLSLYQIANKYRDEPRSRFGLIRTREFIMKDAYTFDKNEEELAKAYQAMFDAYHKIFKRIGLSYEVVQADTGAMGGSLSEEFQAICDIGEDTLVICDDCGYATNHEVCECISSDKASEEKELEKELLHTPNTGTIQDLFDNYGIAPEKTVKTLLYKVDDKFYAFLLRGDRELNENKVKKLLKASAVEMATPEEDEEITSAKVGFAGPIDLEVPIIIDQEVLNMKNFLVGANKTDYHYINVNLKDFTYSQVADIRFIEVSDCCPKCGGKLTFKKGIEVGNTFKLGTKYSESLGLYYTDEENKLKPVVMGCYGIGVARILAAYIEQHHDDDGIIFNSEISPYDVSIVIVNTKDEEQVKLAEEIYATLEKRGVSVLLDNRDVRAGIKFKDMDLIGIPKRITVGRGVSEGVVEYKERTSSEATSYKVSNVLELFETK